MTKRNRDNLVSGLIVVGVIAGSLTLHAFGVSTTTPPSSDRSPPAAASNSVVEEPRNGDGWRYKSKDEARAPFVVSDLVAEGWRYDAIRPDHVVSMKLNEPYKVGELIEKIPDDVLLGCNDLADEKEMMGQITAEKLNPFFVQHQAKKILDADEFVVGLEASHACYRLVTHGTSEVEKIEPVNDGVFYCLWQSWFSVSGQPASNEEKKRSCTWVHFTIANPMRDYVKQELPK